MSDNIDWVVDLDAGEVEAGGLASTVLNWLVQRSIILPTPRPPAPHVPRPLFAPGPEASKYSTQAPDTGLVLCGLEIVTKRTVFHTGGNGIDYLQCAGCASRHDPDVLPWSDAVGAWYENNGSSNMTCPACGVTASIVDWRFLDFEWGFGHLGFGFNNWGITNSLAAEIGAVLGHRHRLVHEHI